MSWWDAGSLRPLRTLNVAAGAKHERAVSRWPLCAAHVVSDCVDRGALLIGCADRSMLLYDVQSWDVSLFEMKGALKLGASPLCMTQWTAGGASWIGVGDEAGVVCTYESNHLTQVARACYPRLPFPRPTLKPTLRFDPLHTDWVSELAYVSTLRTRALPFPKRALPPWSALL